MRTFFIFLLFISAVFANPMALQNSGIDVNIRGKQVLIERKQNAQCLDVAINVETIWGGDYANKNVPVPCKKEVVTAIGKVQPMQFHPAIQTVGEIEVLDFIKNKLARFPDKYLLVDSRRPDWYSAGTIPGAVNIPYDELIYDADLPEDFARMMKLAHVKKDGKKYLFENAKTLLLFCNGSWCGQSPMAMTFLLELGYPPQKLLWFRGGMQDWQLSGLITIMP